MGIIVQARMGSTRLPGKVLKTVLGKSLLRFLLERLQRVKLADHIVVATTEGLADVAILKECESLGINTFQGSERDVLSRYFKTAKLYSFDPIIRITADCPLMDPEIVDLAIRTFRERGGADYVSNCHPRSYPKGMDVEIFTYASLVLANDHAKELYEREHVTPFIHKHSLKKNFEYKRDVSALNLSVDTQEDFDRVREIIEALYPSNPDFSLEDILAFMQK